MVRSPTEAFGDRLNPVTPACLWAGGHTLRRRRDLLVQGVPGLLDGIDHPHVVAESRVDAAGHLEHLARALIAPLPWPSYLMSRLDPNPQRR